MNVLILGGTGVISTAIVDRLHSLSHKVTVLNRGLRKARYFKTPEILMGDKTDIGVFKSLVEGRRFDAVIDMICFKVEDVESTLDVLGDKAGHFVFTSSVAAYKRPIRQLPISEDCETGPAEADYPYGHHKDKMEKFLKTKMGKIPITIIRPSLTYGVGCSNVGVMRNNYGIVDRIRRKKPIVVFGDGTNPWVWTFAPDLAKAYAAVLGRPACYGQTYHATSEDRHIWDDLYTEFGRRVGEEPRLIHISTETLLKVSEDPFRNLFQEKMYCGIFDNSKIIRDAPEFVCDYKLSGIVDALCGWYDSDPEARAVDQNKDKLEDSVVEKYRRCLEIMGER
jgi:nucleoside-diphosphate-sugar epimerase